MIPKTYFRIRIWSTAVKNRVLRYSKDSFYPAGIGVPENDRLSASHRVDRSLLASSIFSRANRSK